MDKTAVMWMVGYFVYSAIVGGMPDPEPTDSLGYHWAYRSLHILAGNITTALSTRYPAMTLPAGTAVAQNTVTTITTPKV